MKAKLQELFRKMEGKQEKGQTLIEYALIIVLIAVVVVIVLLVLGPQIADVFQQIVDSLAPYTTGGGS